MVAIQIVENSDHLLILTSGGRIIRLRMDEISLIGRNTMGRTLVRMDTGENVVDVARAEPSEEDEKEDESTEGQSDVDERIFPEDGEETPEI